MTDFIRRRLGSKDEHAARCRIYFVGCQDMVKIGYTIDIEKRFVAMLTSSPLPLSLLASMPGGPQAEAELHERFRALWRHGEWYQRTPDIDAVIAAAETQYGPEWRDRTARRRGEALQEYLGKLARGEVVRPTRGKFKAPKRPSPKRPTMAERYQWSRENPGAGGDPRLGAFAAELLK
jgi:hypothetical protein